MGKYAPLYTYAGGPVIVDHFGPPLYKRERDNFNFTCDIWETQGQKRRIRLSQFLQEMA